MNYVIFSLLIILLGLRHSIPSEIKSRIIQNLAKLNLSNENVIDSEIMPYNSDENPDSEDHTVVGETKNYHETQDNQTQVKPDVTSQTKNDAYNIKSDKHIGEVSDQAIENSPAITACSENNDNCNQDKSQIIPTLTPTNIPEPTITEFEVIDPPVIIPKPTDTQDINPDLCDCAGNPLRPGIVCPMVYRCIY